MPSWAAASSGLTWLTTSGTPGSIRQALELSITVAPRATAAGASDSRDRRAGREQGDVDPVERVRDGLDDIVGAAGDRHGRTGRATGGHQAQLADREAPFAQDLDHRPTDDAGGADDGDGERSGGHAGQGSTTIFIHPGTAGV